MLPSKVVLELLLGARRHSASHMPSAFHCYFISSSPPLPGEPGNGMAFLRWERKLRHNGGLEVVGPAFNVLCLQGLTLELKPPSVVTAEVAMWKLRRTGGPVPLLLFLFTENSQHCLLRESFSTASLTTGAF